MRIASGTFASNHPALAGHFPGHPIVPGVVLLNEVLLAVERHFGILTETCSWPVVKFMAPLGPHEQFDIDITREDRHRFTFSILRGDRMIASGTLQPYGMAVEHVAS